MLKQEYDQNQAFLDDMARFEKFGFIRSKINFPYNHYVITDTGNQEVFAALARKGCIELIVPRLTANDPTNLDRV